MKKLKVPSPVTTDIIYIPAIPSPSAQVSQNNNVAGIFLFSHNSFYIGWPKPSFKSSHQQQLTPATKRTVPIKICKEQEDLNSIEYNSRGGIKWRVLNANKLLKPGIRIWT